MSKKPKHPGLMGGEVEYKKIGDEHCIGFKGDLDTVHDALVWVNQWTDDGKEAKMMAEFIVRCFNAPSAKLLPFLLKHSPDFFSPDPKKKKYVRVVRELDFRPPDKGSGPLIPAGTVFELLRSHRDGMVTVQNEQFGMRRFPKELVEKVG